MFAVVFTLKLLLEAVLRHLIEVSPPFLTELCRRRGLFQVTFVWLLVLVGVKQRYLGTLMLCLRQAERSKLQAAEGTRSRYTQASVVKHNQRAGHSHAVRGDISGRSACVWRQKEAGWWGAVCRAGASTSLCSRRKGSAARWTWLEASVPSFSHSLSSHGPCKEVQSLPNV